MCVCVCVLGGGGRNGIGEKFRDEEIIIVSSFMYLIYKCNNSQLLVCACMLGGIYEKSA